MAWKILDLALLLADLVVDSRAIQQFVKNSIILPVRDANMGFQKPLDALQIRRDLTKTYSEIASPYNDGFSQWELKKELYEIKFMLDEMLKVLPEFSPEDEWLEEQSKKKVWRELKR